MGDSDLRNSGQTVGVPDARGVTRSADSTQAEGWPDPAGASRSTRYREGESLGITPYRHLAGEPRVPELCRVAISG